MGSLISMLTTVFLILLLFALAVEILSRRVVLAILICLLLFCLHPEVQERLIGKFLPLIGPAIMLILILLGLRMILSGWR